MVDIKRHAVVGAGLVLVLIASWNLWSEVRAQDGGASPSPTPVVMEAHPGDELSLADRKKLLREYRKAQKSQMVALDHQHKRELKELKSGQSAQMKEFLKKEKSARHEFFKAHSNGQERRPYIQSFLERRDALRSHQKDEYKQRIEEQKIRKEALKREQDLKSQEFDSELSRGRRPPSSSWPGALQ